MNNNKESLNQLISFFRYKQNQALTHNFTGFFMFYLVIAFLILTVILGVTYFGFHRYQHQYYSGFLAMVAYTVGTTVITFTPFILQNKLSALRHFFFKKKISKETLIKAHPYFSQIFTEDADKILIKKAIDISQDKNKYLETYEYQILINKIISFTQNQEKNDIIHSPLSFFEQVEQSATTQESQKLEFFEKPSHPSERNVL